MDNKEPLFKVVVEYEGRIHATEPLPYVAAQAMVKSASADGLEPKVLPAST